MASPNARLFSQLHNLGLDPAIYAPIFVCNIALQANTTLYPEAFGETMDYMRSHVEQYALQLPDSAAHWIPVEFIKFLYRNDKNFKQRFGRLLRTLSRRDYREEPEEEVMDIVEGNIGTQFLSLEMTLCVLLHEGRSSLESKKGKEKAHEAALVKEIEYPELEEQLSEAAEATMALVMLSEGAQEEEMDITLEGDAVTEALPELEIEGLYPILIDGIEFLFLDDICKTLGLREDEALSAIAQLAAVEIDPPSSAPPTKTKVDLGGDPLTSELAARTQNELRSIEETVASALVAIKSVEAEYSQVPESAFQRPRRMELSGAADRPGSIKIDRESIVEADELSTVNCSTYISSNQSYVYGSNFKCAAVRDSNGCICGSQRWYQGAIHWS